MKVSIISLWQPFAHLITIQQKFIETRSYNTKHRGLLLIHATKTFKYGLYYYSKPYFTRYIDGIKGLNELGYGQIVGAANLYDTLPTFSITTYLYHLHGLSDTFNGIGVKDWKQEITFGDYLPGRWGWLLKDACKFKQPVDYKGQQGIRPFIMIENIIEQLTPALKELI